MNTAALSTAPYLSAPLIYLWQEFTLYIGPLPENAPHGIYLDTLSASLSNPFHVSTDNWQSSTEVQTVFWPAGCIHQSRYDYNKDIMVFILIEPATPYAQIIKEHMQRKTSEFYYDSAYQSRIIELLKNIYIKRCSSELAYQKLILALDPENRYGTYYKDYKIDPRIYYAMNLLRANPSKNIKVDELANKVNLSSSRLIHLFKEQTGIPISQMRLWLKIKNAIELLAMRNRTLTDAALASGFVDTAHFSRAYKSLTGMTPSAFFQSGRKTETISAV